MDIAVQKIDDSSFVVYDNTYTMLPFKDKGIYKLEMTISNPYIKGGKITLDVLDYLQRHRKERELYIVTSSVLGIREGSLPDGVYNFSFNINNTTTTEDNVAILYGIEKRLDEILKEYGNDIEIKNTGVVFNDYSKVEKIAKVNYAFAMYYDIISNINKGRVVKVNDLIDKLQRLLLVC